jgi:hypothetical protein
MGKVGVVFSQIVGSFFNLLFSQSAQIMDLSFVDKATKHWGKKCSNWLIFYCIKHSKHFKRKKKSKKNWKKRH